MWPPTATYKQLQTSLTSSKWLEMLRYQATQTAVKWTIQEADSDASPFPLPITLAVALQSAHCVVLLGCESYERPSRFEETDARGEGGDPMPARLDTVAGRRVGGRLTGVAAPPRVGQTTLGG